MGKKSILRDLGLSALLLLPSAGGITAAATQAAAQAAAQSSASATFKALGILSTSDLLSYAQNNAASGFCCPSLAYLLPNKVSYPGSTAYTDSLSGYSATGEQQLAPACVVKPTATNDVAIAVAVLSFLGQYTSCGCDFAVKGGGHNFNTGFANIDAGITIDLRGINEVDLSTSGIVKVGGGATWDEVFTPLDAKSLMVTAGRVAGVGVGGLTTGGGVSYYSPQKGWVANGVTNFEVVLPFGKVVNVNSGSYPDLFLVLKGGGNNFGIVTRFDLRTFANGNSLGYGGVIAYPISTKDANLAVYSGLSSNQDIYASFSTGFYYSGGTWIVTNNVFYTKPDTTQWSGYNVITPQFENTLRLANVSSMAAEAGAPTPATRSSVYTATFLNGDLNTLQQVTQATQDLIASGATGIANLSLALYYEPLPAAMFNASAGDDLMGMGASTPDLTIWLALWQWTDPADDAKVAALAAQQYKTADGIAANLGTKHPFLYANYANALQSPYQTFQGDAVSKLKAASAKYDPQGVFQTLLPGGYKIPA